MDALAEIPSEAAIPVIVEALEDSHLKVRYAAVESLRYIGGSYIGSKAAVSHLCHVLVHHEDPTMRSQAAYALRQAGDKTALPHLNKALSDNHPTVQSQASDALKHFEEIPIEVRQLPPFERIKWHVNKIPRLSQHNQLKSKPKDNHIDRSSLIASLQSSDRATRSKAIEQLEKFSNDENFYSEVFRALDRFDVETNHIDAIVELLETTQTIQKSCKYYNYEIYQQAQSVSIQSVQPASVSQVTAEEQYEDILNTISHMARVMEGSPYSFRNMGEEDIRHHFLVQLNGKHRGQATGETFNNKGKPDILIRISDENVLIAECKFWHGAKLLKETILSDAEK